MLTPEPGETPIQFWDKLYGASDRIWSGRVNPRLAEVATDLPAGRALDLGCGEGGDAMWLAEHGWYVVATDVSPVALARATEDAAARGVGDRIEFVRTDLTEEMPAGPFDLVSAHFLHAPESLALDRATLLRAAAESVGPQGLLLIVDHGSAPPWSEHHHDHHFASAADVLDGLQLTTHEWQRIRVEAVERDVTGPQGEVASIADNVILLRRN